MTTRIDYGKVRGYKKVYSTPNKAIKGRTDNYKTMKTIKNKDQTKGGQKG